MQQDAERKAKTIRMNEEMYHHARVAAVTSRKSLGQWLEEAVAEKLDREHRATLGAVSG
jgi:predicted HicB family RNase H-like nuclease